MFSPFDVFQLIPRGTLGCAPRVVSPRGTLGCAPRVVSPRVDGWRVVFPRVDGWRVVLPRVDRWRVVSPRVDRWRVVFPRELGNAPRVVFIPRGHARRVVLNLRGMSGEYAPHGVFPRELGNAPRVVFIPRGHARRIVFLVDDDPGGALVKSSFARLQKPISTAFSIELIFYHRENEGFVFPQLRKGIG